MVEGPGYKARAAERAFRLVDRIAESFKLNLLRDVRDQGGKEGVGAPGLTTAAVAMDLIALKVLCKVCTMQQRRNSRSEKTPNTNCQRVDGPRRESGGAASTIDVRTKFKLDLASSATHNGIEPSQHHRSQYSLHLQCYPTHFGPAFQGVVSPRQSLSAHMRARRPATPCWKSSTGKPSISRKTAQPGMLKKAERSTT